MDLTANMHTTRKCSYIWTQISPCTSLMYQLQEWNCLAWYERQRGKYYLIHTLWLSSAVWLHKEPWQATSCATAVLAHWVGYGASSKWTPAQKKYTNHKGTGEVSLLCRHHFFLFEWMCVRACVCASVPSWQMCFEMQTYAPQETHKNKHL